MPRSLKWRLFFRSPHHKPVWTSLLPNTCHMPHPSHSSSFDRLNYIWWGAQIIKSWLFSLLHFPVSSSILVPNKIFNSRHPNVSNIYTKNISQNTSYIRWIMETTDATIIGVYFLNYIKLISTCFGHYYAHHQEKRKREWLTLHVKLPGCAGCSCMELRCGLCATDSNSFLKKHFSLQL
jgi:hypothetical protein